MVLFTIGFWVSLLFIDKKSINWAIENEKITDYRIIVMKNQEDELNNIIQKIKIPIENKELFSSALLTLKAVLKCDKNLLY